MSVDLSPKPNASPVKNVQTVQRIQRLEKELEATKNKLETAEKRLQSFEKSSMSMFPTTLWTPNDKKIDEFRRTPIKEGSNENRTNPS